MIKLWAIRLVTCSFIMGMSAIPVGWATEPTEIRKTDEFVIALDSLPEYVDPYFFRSAPSFMLSYHLYSTLFVGLDDGDYESEILASYEIINPTTWRLKLRPDVRFSDNSQLTTRDIIYTFDRALAHPSADKQNLIKEFKSYRAEDTLTLLLETRKASPLLQYALTRLPILKYQEEFKFGNDFVEHGHSIGTGAYQLKEITTQGDIRLTQNPYYYGEPPFLKAVRLTRIEDKAKRIAALKEGRIHLIEKVTSDEVTQITPEDPIKVIRRPSQRIMSLQPDVHPSPSPFIRNHEGKPFKDNPLSKLKVRQAISHAINRQQLVEHALQGDGIEADGQLMLPGVLGNTSAVQADTWSIIKARELLAEAGYPDGFQLSIHAPSDRYVGAIAVTHSIAEMLTKIGIETTAITLPKKEFFPAAMKHAYSVSFAGFDTDGNVSRMLDVLTHTQTDTSGFFNLGRYSNPELDALLDAGLHEFDDAVRVELMNHAMEIAMRGKAVIPLYFERNSWAIRDDMGVEFWPKKLSCTVSQAIRSKGAIRK